MARITVIGGTGYTGHHLVREAASRGHEVTSYSRSERGAPVPRVNYKLASVTDAAVQDEALSRIDAAIVALSPRADMAAQYEVVIARLSDLAAERGIRLGIVGGFSSLRPAPDAPRFIDTEQSPPERGREPRIVTKVLDTLLASAPENLDWFFVSPAAAYGAHAPGESLGRYRISGDVALFDEQGTSSISGSDFALAVIDDIEDEARVRTHWSVAY